MLKTFSYCLAAFVAATPAFAADKEVFVPEGMEWAIEEFGLSPAVRVGDLVYLSGIVAELPRDETGAVATADEATLKAAYREAFKTIGVVLAAAGADWSDVVEMTSFHTELPAQGAAFIAVKDEFVTAPYPAWTAIDIDRLWPANGITEIKIVAHAPRK